MPRRTRAEAGVERVNVRFPKRLMEELRRYVPVRKRSQLIVAATEKMLAAIRRKEALAAGAGAWSDENHPDLNSQEDINRYLADLRSSTSRRLSSE